MSVLTTARELRSSTSSGQAEPITFSVESYSTGRIEKQGKLCAHEMEKKSLSKESG